MNDVTFTAPGKGPWELETTHFSRPGARFSIPAYTEAMPRGFAEGTARYGLLLSHLELGVVNGFLYAQPAAFMAPKGAMGPPPKPVLWLLTRLHPKMRARIATSARAFEEKQWRKDLDEWDTKDKPAAIERHRDIQMIDVQALTDERLITHLAECLEHGGRMAELHHKYTATALVVAGDFIAHAVPWTGAAVGEVWDLLKGSSPISNGFAAEELVKAGEALAANDEARAVLRSSGRPEEALETLSTDPDVGPAVRAYIEAVQFRSVGYDVGDPLAGEMPDLLVQALLTAAEGTKPRAADAAAEEALRSKVPAEHREAFDERLAEARLHNRIRDERGVYADGWATGLARRACSRPADGCMIRTAARRPARRRSRACRAHLAAAGEAGPTPPRCRAGPSGGPPRRSPTPRRS